MHDFSRKLSGLSRQFVGLTGCKPRFTCLKHLIEITCLLFAVSLA